ncbi:MAG: SDR family NAD(P)-dependent oxidoreductase [Winogradskyella sp.]|uniref:SDR family NAD(P)-dependent oxidoreductase n=1 Tax=Winogradskyella sp. TaxID=1883156 RepID=UPI00179C2C50|nr:SDR family NAD(P)-dependent oxidoreductase [Winogradskyella sp.]
MQAVIITGINRGLGEAFFNFFISRSDYYIIAVSRKVTPSQEKLLKAQKFTIVHLDLAELRNPQEQLNLDQIIQNYKSILFINNAATINPINSIGDFNSYDISKNIAINVTAPLIITNYLMSLLGEKSLKIINISSGAANKAIVGWSLYCSSKASTEMFFNTLKKQEATNKNIEIYNIDPGVMDSGMQESIRNSDSGVFPRVDDFKNLKSNQQLLKPENVVNSLISKLGI